MLANLLRTIATDITGRKHQHAEQSNDPGAAARLYLDLLKKCVTNAIYDDDLDLIRGKHAIDPATGKYFAVEGAAVSRERKYYGYIWPSRAHTMVGIPRLENVQTCIETVLRASVPGDLIETGVWRGGASIFMRGVLKAYGVSDRVLWVADSFEGLPPVNTDKYPQEQDLGLDRARDLAVSLETVRENFSRYGLLDDQVRFLKGWFRDTLPTAPIEKLAVMRLDGDLYESTMDALVNLYPKLSVGGYVIIDDYNAVPACNVAVTDFRSERGITAELVPIEGVGAFWRKETA